MSLSTGLDRLTFKPVFTPEECSWLFGECEQLEDARWVKRTTMHGHRTLGSYDCEYYSCLNRAIPDNIRQFLKDKSPFDGGELKELVINKYYPGNWIPLHRDTHQYRFFVLVPIQTGGDGVVVEDIFFEDQQGMGLLFDGTGHKHEVLEVRRKRYTVLFLYE